jgi:hypothetical protein
VLARLDNVVLEGEAELSEKNELCVGVQVPVEGLETRLRGVGLLERVIAEIMSDGG